MKNIKVLVILISIFVLSGCTVNYNLTINEDLSISDDVSASESIKYFEENYKYYSRSKVLDAMWENISPNHSYSNLYTYNRNSDNTGIVAKSSYKSLDEYINNNNIYKQYFEGLEYSENNNIITLRTIGKFYPYVQQDPERFAIDSFALNVKIPFKVIESNADKTSGKTYTWYIDKDTEDKSIYLSFDKSIKPINLTILFSIIVLLVLMLTVLYPIIRRNLITKSEIG